MTEEQLARANKLHKEIDRLEEFLSSADHVWTGAIIKRTSKFLIGHAPYGVYDEAIYEMDTKLKNEILSFLKNRLIELYNELGKI
jgi:hypothetical protein